ncbi:hypothetical protein BZL43_23330 [Pseudomonas sp. PICF141]|nr:hypothetical protein BZL43_23330 [Pseudomonas sp. PICF141]
MGVEVVGRHVKGRSVRIVPTLCVGMPQWTLCVCSWDAERPGLHSHAERGNDHRVGVKSGFRYATNWSTPAAQTAHPQ